MGMDSVHLIFLFSFNELTRLGNKVGTEFRGFLVMGEEQCVEDTVHLPSRREAKAVGIRGNNLRDLEGAFLSRGQFSEREVDLQVTRVKPNLCSYFPGGKHCSNLFFDCLSSLSMDGGSLFVSSIQEFESFVESGKECLPNRRVCSGFEIHHE